MREVYQWLINADVNERRCWPTGRRYRFDRATGNKALDMDLESQQDTNVTPNV